MKPRINIRQLILFYGYYKRQRFAEALAQIPMSTWCEFDHGIIACNKLGLHKMVAQSQGRGKNLESGIAMVESLAKCGNSAAAKDALKQIRHRLRSRRLLVRLATNLAPVMPDVALELVDSDLASLPLRVALQIRNNSSSNADLLLKNTSDRDKHRFPELELLMTNVNGGDSIQQLQRINRFLRSRKLSSVALRSGDMPPGPTNFVGNPPNRVGVHNTPLVTVLITAYNAQDRVGYSIESMLNQSWENLEIVVVDDCSEDETATVIQEYERRDSRVRYLQLDKNLGTYVAKTEGLKIAKGDFITCHDADDWAHPLRIEVQIRPLLLYPNLVATTSKWIRMRDDGTFYARPVYPLTRLNPASPLFRRHPVEDGPGLWDLVRTGADSEFLARLRLYFGTRAVKGLPFPLTFGSHRPDSLMTASSTGYDARGISPTRQEYWESWNRWHIEQLNVGSKPRIPARGRVSTTIDVIRKPVTT